MRDKNHYFFAFELFGIYAVFNALAVVELAQLRTVCQKEHKHCRNYRHSKHKKCRTDYPKYSL